MCLLLNETKRETKRKFLTTRIVENRVLVCLFTNAPLSCSDKFFSAITFNTFKALVTPSVSVSIGVDTFNGSH